MIVRFIEAFDDHCLIYFFLIGFALGLNGPEEGSAFYCGGAMTTVGGLAWYSAKALLITGSTIANWDKTNPGEPMFRVGGLTEYDKEKCRQTGQAVVDAIKKSRRSDECE